MGTVSSEARKEGRCGLFDRSSQPSASRTSRLTWNARESERLVI
jgi:hypothetical protein